jgi:hypothetical protein
MRHYYENFFEYPWLWFLGAAVGRVFSIGKGVYFEEQRKYALFFSLLEVGIIYILWKIFKNVGGWKFLISLIVSVVVVWGLQKFVYDSIFGGNPDKAIFLSWYDSFFRIFFYYCFPVIIVGVILICFFRRKK